MTAGKKLNLPEWIKPYLDELGASKISEAVRLAEVKTQGEIVPIVVKSSELSKGFFSRLILRGCLSRSYFYNLVDLRAELEFYRNYQNKTQAHTAILLFISLYEHRAVVLADKAIDQKLPPETWNEVVHLMTSELKNKNLVGGLTKAIEKCGSILNEHFPAQKLNINELENVLVIKE